MGGSRGKLKPPPPQSQKHLIMPRTRSQTAYQQSPSKMIPSNNSGTTGEVSQAWTMARKWKAERDALHAQLGSGGTDTSSEVSQAWARARKWKAERDALQSQNIETIDCSASEVSKAWSLARKWKGERDALQAQIAGSSSGSSDAASKAWAQGRKWKDERDILRANYQALMEKIWEARRDMPFWKQHEHPDHLHPIFEHLHNAGYTV